MLQLQFKNFITLQRGFDLPKKDRVLGDYPVVASTAINGYHAEHKVQPPGVVTGRSGSLGEVLYIDKPFWPLNTTLWVKDFIGNLPLYVYYFLKTLDLKQYNSGAGVPTLNRNHLDTLEIAIHDFQSQRKIASILSAYDDLIENNLRRIKILEEIAQALYREWFVKFRFPGHENVQMVDSQLGKIPDGWEVGSIGDICQVLTGFAFKSKDWSENGIPVIKIKNIRPGNLVETEKADHVPEDIIEQKHEKYYLINGDFLIAMTGATAGKVGKLRTSKQMALNQRVAKIEPTDGFYQYVWCRISNPEAEKEFYRLADGAAQPNMSSSQIEGVSLLIPSSEVRGRFAMIVSPILQQVDNLIFQNTTLRQTRDLLLPKLISGELDVSELEIKTGVS
ncbi:MAG: restriction endonuclease subunit S [Candidatus Latescibacteria bacterium]|nr:restriction endonuclease subunit S [Candidatus Latescibacterota bacterium]